MEMGILGIGEYGATKKANTGIRTFALGSCIALIIHEPVSGTVGMCHIALPDSAISPKLALEIPGRFADTGVLRLLKLVKQYSKTKDGYVVKIVGGAKIGLCSAVETFNIGGRNVEAIKKCLWEYGLTPHREDVGGRISRTVSVTAPSGEITIKSAGRKDWFI